MTFCYFHKLHFSLLKITHIPLYPLCILNIIASGSSAASPTKRAAVRVTPLLPFSHLSLSVFYSAQLKRKKKITIFLSILCLAFFYYIDFPPLILFQRLSISL